MEIVNNKNNSYRITVFGGAHLKPGDPAYVQAETLGRLLGQAGFTVLTGGYIGTMEAVSRGAAEAGGHVVGVTCEEVEAWRKVSPNPWVMEEMRYKTLRERLLTLIDTCDAAIALPGGVGTLTEISLFWNELIIEIGRERPLILVGQEWKTVFETLFSVLAEHTPLSMRKWVSFEPGIESAVNHLHNHFNRNK
jgi:uncharacterized protein (TIGR00730 family)